MDIKKVTLIVVILGIVVGGFASSFVFMGKILLADLEERRRKNTTITSSVGTHHKIKCIDGVNYLTSIGTVKIDPDTLLPETCK